MKRLFLGTTIALLSTVLLAEAQELQYGAILKPVSNPHWNAMSKGMEAAAQETGVEVIVSAVASEGAAEEQLNNCEAMLLRSPKALIVGAINSNVLLPCLKKASDAGVAIVDLDYNLDRVIAEGAGINITFTAGNAGAVTGSAGADFVAERLGSDVEGSVLVLEGLPGNPVSAARASGFIDQIGKVAQNLNVTTLNADWDRTKAANITNDILQRTPDLKVIFAANDTMALGAVETALAAGRSDIIVIGVDGGSDAIQSVKAGRLTATISQFPYLVGRRSVELLNEMFTEGAELDTYQSTGQLVITKEVIEAGTDPMLQYIK